ncbi:MAG TPA: hypothetical protein VFI31_25335 [Pirellulales bacterium]|nr:hypothetical protein [Pirellulales bacterium]
MIKPAEPRPTRIYAACLMLWMAGALATSWLAADEEGIEPAVPQPAKSQLRREGTQLIEEPGRFIAVANRLTFVSSNGVNYVGLENLNLERVGKVVAASSESVDWFITGTVTEYQGSNYLLISRARRQAAAPRVQRRF